MKILIIFMISSRFCLGFRSQTPAFRRSTIRLLARWSPGDQVILETKESAVIQEVRGSGWYSVKIGDDSVRKVRGTSILSRLESTASDPLLAPTVSDSKPEQVTPNSSPLGPRYIAPPPPTLIDLDAAVASLNDSKDTILNETDRLYLKQVQNHKMYKYWVIFTDLHCAPSTLTTTLEILDFVHRQAVERDAGVLFLGDFWHHRGTLRVDCLNAVLERLQDWSVPLVMIPGNHDQVTLGGENHGLTPLQNAFRVRARDPNDSITDYPGPLIFSQPTKFANALFVPHIRDNAVMESVLQSKLANDSSALFVHADVTGAYMNDMIVSTGGVHPSIFPRGKPIYSGHFHKPHTVEKSGIKIEYLGSPFEVSLSEAQQVKSLSVVNTDRSWEMMSSIPLDFGRKHFRAMSIDALLELSPDSDDTTKRVRKGDRIVFSIDRKLLAEYRSNFVNGANQVDSHIGLLQALGASVEVRELDSVLLHEGVEDPSGLFEVEELSLMNTWTKYIENEVKRGTRTDQEAKRLQEAGFAMLSEVEEELETSNASRTNAASLTFKSVSVEGFGPFKHEVQYPLDGRGLVLIRGENKDDGSDSNGSGKSSLAVAILWALTGDIDPRPVQDMKVADVVNDASKYARVSLTGEFDGKQFVISRTKTPNKGNLSFIVDGEDLSAQSIKETQSIMDETFGVSPAIIARTLFHGQHALNGLLETSDVKLKDELSLLVPLDVWQRLNQNARKKARDSAKQLAQIQGKIELRESDKTIHTARYETQSALYDAEKEILSRKIDDIRKQLDAIPPEDLSHSSTDVQALRATIKKHEEEIRAFECELEGLKSKQSLLIVENLTPRVPLQSQKVDLEDELRVLLDELRSKENKLQMVEARKVSIEKLWSINLDSVSEGSVVLPDFCPTCKQAITHDHDDHDHSTVKKESMAEIKEVVSRRRLLEQQVEDTRGAIVAVESQIRDVESACREIENEAEQVQKSLAKEIEELEVVLKRTRESLSKVTATLASSLSSLQAHSERSILLNKLDDNKTKLVGAREKLDFARSILEETEKILELLRSEEQDVSDVSDLMGELSNAFGQKGVQTFVLQDVLDSLKRRTQYYLDRLSARTLRLDMYLDAGEKISRNAFVMDPSGDFKERPLASLSGGQWRRCSLALNLGFADLVAARGKFQPNICILDEPLTHLDQAGRSNVGQVLRSLLRPADGSLSSSPFTFSTILMILQDLAAEELEEAFDRIDVVEKRRGSSHVLVDEEM